jgi:hypothetical protein
VKPLPPDADEQKHATFALWEKAKKGGVRARRALLVQVTENFTGCVRHGLLADPEEAVAFALAEGHGPYGLIRFSDDGGCARCSSEKWQSEYRKTMRRIGRKGGKSRSPAKVAAARLNGAKGGRPPKTKNPSISADSAALLGLPKPKRARARERRPRRPIARLERPS